MIEKTMKFPFIKILVGHFELLLKANRNAWLVCALFALLETVVFVLSGNMEMCISSHWREKYFCCNSIYLFGAAYVAIFFIKCMFIRNWIEIALDKKDFDIKRVICPNMADLKISGLFLLYSVTLLISAGSLYLLYIRVPNPDWRIELTYFGVVSIGFLFPLIGFRFLSWIAFAAEGEKLPSLANVWSKTSGYSFSIGGGAMLIFLVFLYVSMQSAHFSMAAGQISSYMQGLTIEYIINFIKLVIVAIIANFCYTQYDVFFKEQADDKK